MFYLRSCLLTRNMRRRFPGWLVSLWKGPTDHERLTHEMKLQMAELCAKGEERLVTVTMNGHEFVGYPIAFASILPSI